MRYAVAHAEAPQTKAEQTRMNILRAAARQFNLHGYEGTSLRSIGDEAQLKAGSMYYHFDSKDELLQEVIDLGVTVIHEAVVAALAGLPMDASPRRRIETAVRTHCKVLLEYGEFTSASIRIYGQVPEGVRLRNKQVRQRYGDYWTGLLEEARRAGVLRRGPKPKMVRLLLIGMMNSTVEWYQPERGSGKPIADVICSMLFDGLLEPNGTQGGNSAGRSHKTARTRRSGA